MKKIVMAVAVVACMAKTMYAITSRVALEVLDKNPNSVWLVLKNGDSYFTKHGWEYWEYESNPSKDIVIKYEGVADPKGVPYGYQILPGAPTTIALWLHDPQSVKVIKQTGKPDSLVPAPDKYWTFTQGKDIYVTLDPSNSIRPQTGTYMGWSGQSASGHSLERNISANDIKPITE